MGCNTSTAVGAVEGRDNRPGARPLDAPAAGPGDDPDAWAITPDGKWVLKESLDRPRSAFAADRSHDPNPPVGNNGMEGPRSGSMSMGGHGGDRIQANRDGPRRDGRDTSVGSRDGRRRRRRRSRDGQSSASRRGTRIGVSPRAPESSDDDDEGAKAKKKKKKKRRVRREGPPSSSRMQRTSSSREERRRHPRTPGRRTRLTPRSGSRISPSQTSRTPSSAGRTSRPLSGRTDTSGEDWDKRRERSSRGGSRASTATGVRASRESNDVDDVALRRGSSHDSPPEASGRSGLGGGHATLLSAGDLFGSGELDAFESINNAVRPLSAAEQKERRASFAKESERLVETSALIRWKRGRIIGMGAFGKVYLGKNLETDEIMAVKVIEIGGMSMRESRVMKELRMVENEIAILQNLRHDNIVRYIGIGRVDEPDHDSMPGLEIYMEYIDGGSLASLLQREGALDEEVTVVYALQIVRGLVYLHSQGIAHRDIKAANILISSAAYVGEDISCSVTLKIADFGASKVLSDLVTMADGGAQTLVGTPYFMAPEVVLQSGHGKKADVWSLGCTVIEMMTGKPPWHDHSPMGVLFRIGTKASPPPLPRNLSSPGCDFLMRCFIRDVHERPRARQIAAHEWLQAAYDARPRETRPHLLADPDRSSVWDSAQTITTPASDSAGDGRDQGEHRGGNGGRRAGREERVVVEWDRPLNPTSREVYEFINHNLNSAKRGQDSDLAVEDIERYLSVHATTFGGR